MGFCKSEDKEKACKAFLGKLSLLGIHKEMIDTLFEVNFIGVAVDLIKLAIIQEYPVTLHIPSFVDKLKMDRDYYSSIEDDSKVQRKLKRVKHIFAPDDMKVDNEAFIAFSKFPNLKSVSLTSRQYSLRGGIEFKYDLRIPEDANMIATEDTKELINFVCSQYAVNSGRVSGQDLFIAFEIASRAANEETALSSLGLFMLENDLCSPAELNGYMGKKLLDSICELLDQKSKTDWHKAAIIKKHYWLHEAFDIKEDIIKKYNIETGSRIAYHLTYPGDKVFDIGQTLKVNLKVDKNAMQGFTGGGGLSYFKYIMQGKVSTSLALDIIRLTSEYVNVHSVVQEIDRPGYNQLFLDFFRQDWFKDWGTKSVWCYPNGRIQAQGYDSIRNLGEIILEACFLASTFKTLRMQVALINGANEDSLFSNDDDIIIDISDGSVEVKAGSCEQWYNSWEPDEKYIEKINKMFDENKLPLSADEFKVISQRNKLDHEDEDIYAQKELSDLITFSDVGLAFRLIMYIQDTTDVRLDISKDLHFPSYQILKNLFDFDMDKLKQYMKETKLA